MLLLHLNREEERTPAPPKAPRVLLCEDDRATLLQLRNALLRSGYQIVGETAEGATAIALAGENAPDVILMDIDLAGEIDDITATREIRRSLAVPIILLTGYRDASYVNAALGAGACSYLVKPITGEQLIPEIEAAVARFHTLQAALRNAVGTDAA